MYPTDTIVGTYNYIQHPSQCPNIEWDRQIIAKNGLKFNLIQSDRSKDKWFSAFKIASYLTEEPVLKLQKIISIKLQIQNLLNI